MGCPWLRLLYVTDALGQKHYEPVGSLLRIGDEVTVSRASGGLAVEGYGVSEVWATLELGDESREGQGIPREEAWRID